MNKARSSWTSFGLCALLLGVLACDNPTSDAPKNPVDGPPEMLGRVVVGYQGWFTAAGDGLEVGFNHWGHERKFGPEAITIDFWPDMSESEPDERYPTVFRHSDGKVATVFSSAHPKTVMRHFRWPPLKRSIKTPYKTENVGIKSSILEGGRE